MYESIMSEKALLFAGRIIKLHEYLTKKREYIISKQIVRSGTSIGANLFEADYAQSTADFVSKLHIALKETSETEYWLKLLRISDHISDKMAESMLKDCIELKKMLVSAINTAKKNYEK